MEDKPEPPPARPDILAPAGDMRSALAALAAGADAVYLGLKHFSARMQAANFSTGELARLADLAHAEGRRIYVAMNSLIKPSEPDHALRLVRRLALDVAPDALIIQDLSMLDLARQAGFQGELHLSTLANATHPQALRAALDLGVQRVILPRELSLEETRRMATLCPQGLDLEIFVHGALCHCVSGRCWWSSYLGGKSGLRGRCVQPCRRVYRQKGKEGRFFSCGDLSLDVRTSFLPALPRLRAWKIEGRKKGPHYVYYVTTAYRLLRDSPEDREAVREALEILKMSLGRQSSRAFFPSAGSPVPPPAQKRLRTGSGLLVGLISGTAAGGRELRPAIPLLPRDLLRIGHEDEPWHCTLPLSGRVPEGEALPLSLPRARLPQPGTPVFLIDRQSPELLAVLAEWEEDLAARAPLRASRQEDVPGLRAVPPVAARLRRGRPLDVLLLSSLPHGRAGRAGIRPGAVQGLWLSPKAVREVSRTLFSRISWWLPPVIWPEEEDLWADLIQRILRGGARHVVCNAPWQIAFFPKNRDLALTAGPFCNSANVFALGVLARAGFSLAIVSPELGEGDLLSLPAGSPLPLGIVLSGFWPVGIARHSAPPLKAGEAFASPRGEEFWMRRYGPNTWIYPAWPLDLAARRPALEQAGYTVFISMQDHPPARLTQAPRPGEFNWRAGML
ncbi:MAG: U32 family peptidase [Desulfovibrio sp.]|nr:U32 family peptidase [Desulfovibrio sp.]